LIKLFTDEGDVVIDPLAGSGSSLIAAFNCNRKAYGFEIKKDYYKAAKAWIDKTVNIKKDIEDYGYAKTEIQKIGKTLFES